MSYHGSETAFGRWFPTLQVHLHHRQRPSGVSAGPGESTLFRCRLRLPAHLLCAWVHQSHNSIVRIDSLPIFHLLLYPFCLLRRTYLLNPIFRNLQLLGATNLSLSCWRRQKMRTRAMQSTLRPQISRAFSITTLTLHYPVCHRPCVLTATTNLNKRKRRCNSNPTWTTPSKTVRLNSIAGTMPPAL
jgi:hypothetical protein